ncbi:MAG TPA: S8 family serine peptidase [Gemmatimonadales bacterium]|jgi:subtilisin family serine protease
MSISWTTTVLAVGAVILSACDDVSTGPVSLGDAATTAATSGINVLLKSKPTAAIVADLNTMGTVLDLIPQLNAVTMRASASSLGAIRAKPYVASAATDVAMAARPEPVVVASEFVDGRSTWNLDAVNVTVTPGFTGRDPKLKGISGEGVYVAILDSGLIPEWQALLPVERIDVSHARAFGGGGGEKGTISTQPDKWEKDVVGHGTAIASIIVGYRLSVGAPQLDGPVNGVAPEATVIPVRVLNQNNSTWGSVEARGIVYIADLKAQLNAPVVINVSIGGPGFEPIEQAALDYAISKGVIVVVSGGNDGPDGSMTYPAAYPPVISVGATGWVHQWEPCGGGPPVFFRWVTECDIAEPIGAGDFYLAEFSSREGAGQQLDLAAPGFAVLLPAPYHGSVAYGYWVGTSFAAPHVAGVAALMAQKKPSLTQAEAELTLKNTAAPLPPGSRQIYEYFNFAGEITNQYVTVSWGADATGAGMLDAVAAVKATN